ncbi:MAG: BatD family protein [Tahibacter sp.]
MKRMQRVARICLLVGLLFAIPASAADLRAWLDRDNMQLGETVTLNVEVSAGSSAEPDFSPLQIDFDLLGTSSSSSVNIVNGQTTSKQLWAVGLQPKHAGLIAIPALKVGSASTGPLGLTVQAAAATPSGHSGDEVYVEVVAQPDAPYVQQQIRFSVKLYYSVQLTEGSLDEPRVDGLVVQKLGQDRNYEADQDGRRYKVLERRYALLPEKSGVVQIPSINFRGRALGGNDPGAGFFSRGRVATARSKELSLTVRPRPSASGSGPWLPAQTLQLDSEGIDATATARVGEPITLTLTLRAQGLGFEQLPELELPKIDGAEVYPDKSNTRTRDDGTWLFGERSRKFAIVPNRPGKLVLPAIRLDWWDTAQDRPEHVAVGEREIEVAAAVSSAAVAAPLSPTTTLQSQPASTAEADRGSQSATMSSASPGPWRAIALGSLGLWLVTAIFLVARFRHGVQRAQPTSAAQLAPSTSALGSRGAFARSLAQRDTAAVSRALLRWAQAEGLAVRNLGELAQQLDSAEQRAAIQWLQQSCFAANSTQEWPAHLSQAFDAGLVRARLGRVVDAESALPPLWPQSAQRRA